MKQAMVIVCLMVCAAFLFGCASVEPRGILLMELKVPVVATANGNASPKMGVAECETICGLIARGDASIAAAKKNGGITKVHHVDWEVSSLLGLIGKYKCIVYGE